MTRQKVLLLGATGETGRHILDALVADESFVSAPFRTYLRSIALNTV
jgi:uncharacterized protein YbjT (DUF2867 family)